MHNFVYFRSSGDPLMDLLLLIILLLFDFCVYVLPKLWTLLCAASTMLAHSLYTGLHILSACMISISIPALCVMASGIIIPALCMMAIGYVLPNIIYACSALFMSLMRHCSTQDASNIPVTTAEPNIPVATLIKPENGATDATTNAESIPVATLINPENGATDATTNAESIPVATYRWC